MIHPSYVDLMEVVNRGAEEGDEPVISSRYSIVMATARRARQIIAGDEPLVRARGPAKALSIAVEELNSSEVKILSEQEKIEAHERRQAELLAEAAERDGHTADEVSEEVAEVMEEDADAEEEE